MALTWIRTHDWDAEEWRNRAACRDTSPELFFPIGTTGVALDQIDAAKRVCGQCPVTGECLEFALAHQPGGRRLGRHSPKKSAAGCARAGRAAPSAQRRLAAPTSPSLQLDPRHRDRHAHAHRRAVVAVHLDRAAELAGDERLHDREAEPLRRLEREPVGQAGAVVDAPRSST